MAGAAAYVKRKFDDPVFTFQYYQVLRYLVSIILSVIMVKSGIKQMELGQYEIWIFVVTSMTFFWSAGIKNALLSFYPTLDAENGRKLLSGVFIFLSALGILFGAFLFLFPSNILKLFTDQTTLPNSNVIAVYLALSVPVVLTENILYLQNRLAALIQYTHWSLGVSLVIFLIVAYFKPSLPNFIYALLCTVILRCGYLLWVLYRAHFFPLNIVQLKLFLVFAIPLICNMLLSSAMDFIDGWFVSRFFDTSFFPVFRYGARELPFSSILFSSLSAAMIPVLIREGYHTDILKKKVDRLMHIMFPASMLIMLMSPVIFPWIYSAAYKESAFIFNIYLLILTSRVLMPQTYNFALHQHKIIIFSGILEILVNIILSYWWMQMWGVYGLAMATVVAYFIQKAILIFYNSWYNGIPVTRYLSVKMYLFYCFASVITFLLTFSLLK